MRKCSSNEVTIQNVFRDAICGFRSDEVLGVNLELMRFGFSLGVNLEPIRFGFGFLYIFR